MRVHHQPAYILINRPYSESSWIVEVFTRQYGRLSLMAKGARRIKSRSKGVLLPFQPVLLSWTGKGEVPTLTSSEIDQAEYNLIDHELRGDSLVCGFYCNELLINLLHRNDPHAKLFDRYHSTIMALNNANINDGLSSALRGFERAVMKETGYEIDFEFESDGRTPVSASADYRFHHGQGFVRLASPQRGSVVGRVIQSMVSDDGADYTAQELSQGKHLMRDILRNTLNNKDIVSRELFFPRSRSID